MLVEVIAHNSQWADEFKKEAHEIQNIYGDLVLEIHHIGSTAITGLKAKPIIDIMPVVSDINKVDNFDEQMRKLGYEPLGEHGIAGRRFFKKDDSVSGKRTHHVHIFDYFKEDEITRHLAFKTYLSEHPEIARKYGELKAKLANKHPNDIEAYMDGKNDFIKEIEQQAVRWYKSCFFISLYNKENDFYMIQWT